MGDVDVKGTTDESVIKPIRAALINWEYEPATIKEAVADSCARPDFAANDSNGVPGCSDSILAPLFGIPESAMDKLINIGGAVQIASADGVSWSIERLRARSKSRRDVNVM